MDVHHPEAEALNRVDLLVYVPDSYPPFGTARDLDTERQARKDLGNYYAAMLG